MNESKTVPRIDVHGVDEVRSTFEEEHQEHQKNARPKISEVV